IFIAGNEEFTQGKVDFKESCRKAIAKGIIVNTIFCGNKQEGISTHWKDGADMADGRFMTIDQNAQVADIDAPQDKEIAALGTQLNQTYIAYGTAGAQGAARQNAQDVNVASKMSANVQRQVAKSSGYYSNASWDLVDAKKNGVDIEKIEAKQLPPEMQKMTPPQRKAYVEQNEKKRAEIQTKIQKLDTERKKYVAEQMKKLPPAASTLDAAVVTTVREVGAKKGYKF
ncbi:MAG TPA: VWA domain-containing protein, partial [Thermoanaerobaculia bacterium]|nr:VWA domain-containing protein [Thermoanaerobaculia bacterium]